MGLTSDPPTILFPDPSIPHLHPLAGAVVVVVVVVIPSAGVVVVVVVVIPGATVVVVVVVVTAAVGREIYDNEFTRDETMKVAMKAGKS